MYESADQVPSVVERRFTDNWVVNTESYIVLLSYLNHLFGISYIKVP
jgi:hypothetical protein